jgi:hypothetical protein
VNVGNKQHREKVAINTPGLFIFNPHESANGEGSRLVTTILVVRFRVLVVPTLVMGIPLPLVMSTMGIAMFPAAIARTAIASMLRFD